MKKLTVTLSEETARELKIRAAQRFITISEILEHALAWEFAAQDKAKRIH